MVGADQFKPIAFRQDAEECRMLTASLDPDSLLSIESGHVDAVVCRRIRR
jgi:hypothetical protein